MREGLLVSLDSGCYDGRRDARHFGERGGRSGDDSTNEGGNRCWRKTGFDEYGRQEHGNGCSDCRAKNLAPRRSHRQTGDGFAPHS